MSANVKCCPSIVVTYLYSTVVIFLQTLEDSPQFSSSEFQNYEKENQSAEDLPPPVQSAVNFSRFFIIEKYITCNCIFFKD